MADDEVKQFQEDYPDIHASVETMIQGRLKEIPTKPTAPDPMAAFHHGLDRDVPDWKQINTSPEFMRFLTVPDPNAPGMTKLQSIKLAFDARDVMTVIRYFNEFKNHKRSEAARVSKPDHEGIKKFYADAQRGVYGPIGGEKFRLAEARVLGPLKKKG